MWSPSRMPGPMHEHICHRPKSRRDTCTIWATAIAPMHLATHRMSRCTHMITIPPGVGAQPRRRWLRSHMLYHRKASHMPCTAGQRGSLQPRLSQRKVVSQLWCMATSLRRMPCPSMGCPRRRSHTVCRRMRRPMIPPTMLCMLEQILTHSQHATAVSGASIHTCCPCT